MRSRSRRSASNYFSAALLELSIMGMFVIIAQPQLREALVELVHPTAINANTELPRHAVPSASTRMSTALPVADAVPTSSLHTSLSSVGAHFDSAANDQVGWSMRTASYAPLDRFESFSIAVPSSSASQTARPIEQSVPQHRVAHYAPTQLASNDWTIGAAVQSPRPLSGWTVSRPADARLRDTYPPPYGTQSQWK